MTTVLVKQIYHNFIGSEMASGITDFKHDQLQRFKMHQIQIISDKKCRQRKLIKPDPDLTQQKWF